MKLMEANSLRLQFFLKKLGMLFLTQIALAIPLGLLLLFGFQINQKTNTKNSCEQSQQNLVAQFQTYTSGFPQVDVIAQFSFKQELKNTVLTDTQINTSLINSLGLNIEKLILAAQGTMVSFSRDFSSRNSAFSAFKSGSHQFFIIGEKNSKDKTQDVFIVYPHSLITRINTAPNCHLSLFTKNGVLIFSTQKQPLFKNEFTTSLIAEKQEEKFFSRLSQIFQSKLERTTEFQAESPVLTAEIIDFSSHNNETKNLFFTLIILFIMAAVLQATFFWPEWRLEETFTNNSQKTLNQFLNGQFNARLRLFATNHFASLEKTIDQMGFFLSQLKIHGSSLNKTKMNWEQYNEYIKNTHSKELIVLSLNLPPLSNSINHSTEIVKLYNEVSDFFIRATEQNSGTIDFTLPHQMQSVWGLINDTEFDAANAVMSALSIKIAIDQINERLKANGQKTIEAGIGIHKAESQITLLGSNNNPTLSIVGAAPDEALLISKLAAQSHHEILISESLANVVRNYFVILQVKDLPWSQRSLFEVRGYIDTQETPVLVKNRK